MTQMTGTFSELYSGYKKKTRGSAMPGMGPLKRKPRVHKAPNTLTGRRNASRKKAADAYGE